MSETENFVSAMNWQTMKPSIKERIKFMLNNDLFSDVKFLVFDEMNESKQAIPAHRFVLSISSPVFEAMFYGQLAETSGSIELPDCDYESLLELFRYLYSDEVNLKDNNVMGVLYVAKKYAVTTLADKCIKYLQNMVDPSNVLRILSSAIWYQEKNLVDWCWRVIEEQTKDVVKADNVFATIEKSLLDAIVHRDTLNIKEVDLFRAVDFWAKRNCESQGLIASGKEKRKILGERIVKSIRFPTMEQVDFAIATLDSKILSGGEIVRVIHHMNSVLSSPVGFPAVKRSGFFGDIKRCCRFGSVSSRRRWKNDFSKDSINISVDRDLRLHGVRLFGGENNSCWVVLEIRNAENRAILTSKAGWFSSQTLHGTLGQYCGFEVLFDSAVGLKRCISYSIEVSITGSDSCSGRNGYKSVKCHAATITFVNSKYCENGTSVKCGQIPEVLFSM